MENLTSFLAALNAHAQLINNNINLLVGKSFTANINVVVKSKNGISVENKTISVMSTEFYSNYHFFDKDKGLNEYLKVDNYNIHCQTEGCVQRKLGIAVHLDNDIIVYFGITTDVVTNDGFNYEFETRPFTISISQQGQKQSPFPIKDALIRTHTNKIVKLLNTDYSNLHELAINAYEIYNANEIKKLKLPA